MKVPLSLFAGLALSAQAPGPEALTAHLREAAVVHLAFHQTRTLAALSRPLRSSGSLVLARDLGVIWELQKPVAMTYVMGPKGLLVVAGDGRRERRTARDAPVVAQMMAETTGRTPSLDAVKVALGVDAAYLDQALKAIRAEHGSVDAYLEQALGMDAKVREGVEARLVG